MIGDHMSRTKEREIMITSLYARSMSGNYEDETMTSEMRRMIVSIEEHFTELDEIIANHLENWTIDRLNYVDKMIIRFAVYEMKYTDTPFEVIINEAIELTKKYTNLDDDKAKSFNNKLLDKIKNSLYK
ncbi:MAG: transcription antitermination factor NusB [Tenericutes bacterium HGW-Tenericutes-1]|jgi:N utilization substance protein B|nr:MAG: transcription antitermination factor NusB [Tenericutes bacterium HGW-Tenericutes-1]